MGIQVLPYRYLSQVKIEADNIQFHLAVQVAKGQADALFSRYQLKYSATIAQCKLEEERLKPTKLQQLVALKEIEQAQKYEAGRMKAQQDLDLLDERIRQMKESMEQKIHQETKQRQEVLRRLEEEQRKSSRLEENKRKLEDQIRESMKQEKANQTRSKVLQDRLQETEQRLRSIEESRQERTSSTTTEAETEDDYMLDYPLDALDTLPFPTFLPPLQLTHLSGRWISGEEGLLWVTYQESLPWVVPRNTTMTDDHWLNRIFKGERCSRTRLPDLAMPSKSHVTRVYVKSRYNDGSSQPLEAEGQHEGTGRET